MPIYTYRTILELEQPAKAMDVSHSRYHQHTYGILVINLRNSFRANYCQCVDSIAPEINNSIDSFIDNWEVVSQSSIFRVDFD